ncbi:MAG: hypothetical protein QM652_08390 [Legionella sp.]|uniref:hypothetical protein n=1 Tax=Legionella sp. TaxID=459 RepID=UPI0039E21973
MKKRWYLICFLFCVYLLLSIPLNADAGEITGNTLVHEDSSRSFKIAPNIPEFTLIFKKGIDIKDLYLISPNGIKYSLAKENNGFLATKNYEVVQMKKPLSGEWRLLGPEQKTKRILILTNVHLATNFNTGLYFNNEYIILTGYLEQDGKPITNDMAVDGMNMNLELKNKDHTFSYVIPYNNHGLFDNNLILNIPVGTYKATWSAQSTYLSQKLQFMIVVDETPFRQNINLEHDELMLQLVKPETIKDSTVAVKIFYNNKPQDVKIIKTALAWIANFYPLCEKPGFTEDEVLIQVTAQMFSGRDLVFKLLLDEKICSPNYVPSPLTQSVNPQGKPLLKPSEKTIKNNTKFKKHYVFLILIIVLAALISIVLLGIRYKNKINKIKEEL